MHPILAYGIHDERRRGGFTVGQLDPSYHFIRRLALWH